VEGFSDRTNRDSNDLCGSCDSLSRAGVVERRCAWVYTRDILWTVAISPLSSCQEPLVPQNPVTFDWMHIIRIIT
jgi:hypothetical protein